MSDQSKVATYIARLEETMRLEGRTLCLRKEMWEIECGCSSEELVEIVERLKLKASTILSALEKADDTDDQVSSVEYQERLDMKAAADGYSGEAKELAKAVKDRQERARYRARIAADEEAKKKAAPATANVFNLHPKTIA